MSYYPEQEQEYEFYADPTMSAQMMPTAAPMMATAGPTATINQAATATGTVSPNRWDSMKRNFRGQNGRRNTLLTVILLLLLVCLAWYLYKNSNEVDVNTVKFQRFRFRR